MIGFSVGVIGFRFGVSLAVGASVGGSRALVLVWVLVSVEVLVLVLGLGCSQWLACARSITGVSCVMLCTWECFLAVVISRSVCHSDLLPGQAGRGDRQ